MAHMDTTEKNYWLLLKKSDATLITKGIDAYHDIVGEIYSYDSFVPNHKNLEVGDVVIMRVNDLIVGHGIIKSIKEEPSKKPRRRCPKCNKTDIRERLKKTPKWKCGKCAHEFSEPVETLDEAIAYTAEITGFTRPDLWPEGEKGRYALRTLPRSRLNSRSFPAYSRL